MRLKFSRFEIQNIQIISEAEITKTKVVLTLTTKDATMYCVLIKDIHVYRVSRE